MGEKKYLTINELIENIKNKNIIIEDENETRKILETNNYYFIMGYKFAFKLGNGAYKQNTYFNDIFKLYKFDKSLKLLFLEPVLLIEQKLKTIFTNNYCTRYGFKLNDILNQNNYDKSNLFLDDTLQELNKQIKIFGENNKAVIFYNHKYHFVPLWVYMKVISFGMIRDLFYVSKPADKTFMINKLINDKLSTSDASNMLRLLVRIRNICCHDDILLSYVDDKLGIKTTIYHYHFNLIKDKNDNIIQGKKDIFAVLIIFKIFLKQKQFNLVIDNLTKLIDDYCLENKSISREHLLSIMHLPNNFEDLKKL